jgi:hypothetical protein
MEVTGKEIYVSSEKIILDQCSLTFQCYFSRQNPLVLARLTDRIVIGLAMTRRLKPAPCNCLWTVLLEIL